MVACICSKQVTDHCLVIASPSDIAAFLSPNSAAIDGSCSGPNGGLDPYCSIEQYFTQNQPVPSVTSAGQAQGSLLASTQNGAPTTAPIYNPNDLTPAQMSQILGALQPSQASGQSITAQSSAAPNTNAESSSTAETSSAAMDISSASVSASSPLATTSNALSSSASPSSNIRSATQEASSSSGSSNLGTTLSSPPTSTTSAISSGTTLLSATSTKAQTGSSENKDTPSTSSIVVGNTEGTATDDNVPFQSTQSGSPLSEGSPAAAESRTTSAFSVPPASLPIGSGSFGQVSESNAGSTVGIGPIVGFAQQSGSLLAVGGSVTLTQGAPPVTIASTPISLGTNGVLIAGGNIQSAGLSTVLPTGLAGSAPPALGSGFYGAAPPYPIPTGILPPGHQSPTGVLSFNGSSSNSSRNGTSVLPFTGEGTRMWDLIGGWWNIACAGIAVGVLACGSL